jgi:hypothetical protein
MVWDQARRYNLGLWRTIRPCKQFSRTVLRCTKPLCTCEWKVSQGLKSPRQLGLYCRPEGLLHPVPDGCGPDAWELVCRPSRDWVISPPYPGLTPGANFAPPLRGLIVAIHGTVHAQESVHACSAQEWLPVRQHLLDLDYFRGT